MTTAETSDVRDALAPPIWIVDDDPSIRFVLEKALARERLPTRSFSHAGEALEALTQATQGGAGQTPQALVSDIRMPGGSGLELLAHIKTLLPGLPVIIMTAYSDLDSAVAAFQGGAFEYLPKPFDVPHAVALIRRAMQEKPRAPQTQPPAPAAPEMLGQASAMQEVFRAIGRLSASHATVLITGESGSGKELVARALHRHSPRAGGPFIAINTAAIPKDLLESELFGHERGAFTGAQALRRGHFEQAEGGTLFLDEIGDMPLELQTRLLRVLSDGHFYRVGGHSPIQARARVIAATHQSLEQRVASGSFRADLFHRLNVIRLRLPPLRERREDIAALAQHFLRASAQQLGVEAKRLSPDALRQLERFDFPGNVRQLENICHWLSVMAPATIVEAKDLPPEVQAAQAAPLAQPTPAPGQTPPPGAGSDTALNAATAATAPHETAREQPPPAHATHATPATHETPPAPADWEQALHAHALALLAQGQANVWEQLMRRAEAQLLRAALASTQGRRIEAAQRLGIGRNTLTRKLQELGLDSG